MFQYTEKLTKALLLTFFLISQIQDTAHVHPADGLPIVDCEVCVHLSGADDALAVESISSGDVESFVFSSQIADHRLSREAIESSARGPPHA